MSSYEIMLCSKEWPRKQNSKIVNTDMNVEKKYSLDDDGSIKYQTVMENSLEVPPKSKIRTNIWSNKPISGYLVKENEASIWKRCLNDHDFS